MPLSFDAQARVVNIIANLSKALAFADKAIAEQRQSRLDEDPKTQAEVMERLWVIRENIRHQLQGVHSLVKDHRCPHFVG